MLARNKTAGIESLNEPKPRSPGVGETVNPPPSDGKLHTGMEFLMNKFALLAVVILSLVLIGCSQQENSGVTLASAKSGQVVFTGGHETEAVDNGRPVVLIGNALGVEPEVFRDAFSGVTPAKNGSPTAEHARANKKILMDKLSPHGITNERLDEVSNFYRYRPQNGELWKHKPAVAVAIIEDGTITGFNITDGGYGYSSPPQVQVAGHEDVVVKAELEFTTDLETNGRVKSLTVVE